MSYFWPEGYPIVVRTDGLGQPHLFTWDWYIDIQEIILISDRWSLTDPWEEEPQKRTYYTIATETGIIAIIFVNILTQAWYIQWAYD
jgi:hypothetical protein